MPNNFRLSVSSPNVVDGPDHIEADYCYQTTDVTSNGGKLTATPRETKYTFRTEKRVPRVGCMLVGWGGNNGSTVTAAVLANKMAMRWNTKEGEQEANFYGSITQASTVCLGTSPDGSDVFIPFKELLPMVDPLDIVFDGMYKMTNIVFM